MDDLISRQMAIDIERNATVDTNPTHFEAHQKFIQFMDDAGISSFGRWQWSNGFNTALTAVGIDLKKLPSAQTELITKIQNGIKVTDADDVYSCGMRNGMRWCISLIDDKEPLYENCPSAQPEKRTEERTETHASDCISRREAIEALFDWEMTYDWDDHCREEDPKPTYIVSPSDVIEQLPSAQPEIIRCCDCIHFEYFKDQFVQMTHCDVHDRCPDYTDYCSWAERKEPNTHER